MFEYSQKVMDHFMNPRNVGEIKDANGAGTVGNPICGDLMTFYIKVEDNRLNNVKFKTFGCGAAIAVSSIVSEIARGKTLDEAMKITNKMKNSYNLSQRSGERSCLCPYCDATLSRPFPFCQTCGKEVNFCPRCGAALPKRARLCPACGKQLSNRP